MKLKISLILFCLLINGCTSFLNEKEVSQNAVSDVLDVSVYCHTETQ